MAEKPLRLLLFNLVTDADHLVLAFTTDWINELAPYCEYIDVVTMQVGRLAVADNVRVFSVGRELAAVLTTSTRCKMQNACGGLELMHPQHTSNT